MKQPYNKFWRLLICLLVFVSCKEDADKGITCDDEIKFNLYFTTRTGIDSSQLEEYSDFFKEGESCVLVSQRSTTMQFSFNEESSNCYKYIYYTNPDADWDNNYNFRSDNPMTWTRIKQKGQYSSGYYFGALYYPRYFTQSDAIDADQSNYEALVKNDILGATHRTSSEDDRLTFRLNHLMCKLKINLYIPPYNEETNNGIEVDDIIATAISFRTDYAISWGERSTEEPPLAKPKDMENPETKDITLYKGPIEENVVLKDLNKHFDIYDISEDNVTKYSFEMLFPQQTVSGDILRFTLIRGDLRYNYVFNTGNLTQNNGNVPFEPGTVTQLELYLPRTDNQIVVLKAYLHDWEDADSSFTLTKEYQ